MPTVLWTAGCVDGQITSTQPFLVLVDQADCPVLLAYGGIEYGPYDVN